MAREQFIFPTIQIRSALTTDKKKRVVVKGYAVAPDIPHDYMVQKDSSGKVIKTFKSLFTKKFVDSMKSQMNYKPIFVDALHQTAANINIRTALENIKSKSKASGHNFESEVDSIMSNLKVSQFPLGKPVNFNIDDNGMFVEVELNPEFRDVDTDHRNYYDAVVNSLQNGNLNTMSINFQATDMSVDDRGLEKIDDGKFYGISFMPDGALGAHSSITEVAIRSMIEVRNTMETQPTETKPQPVQTTPIQNQNQATAELEAKYAEAQAKIQEMQAEQEKEKQKTEYAKQMETMKKEILESVQQATGPKGVVSDPAQNNNQSPDGIKSAEEFREKIKDLSWNEKIQLQADLANDGAVGNEMANRLGLLKKDVDMNFNK